MSRKDEVVEILAEYVCDIVRGIVSHPEEVHVDFICRGQSVRLLIHANQADLGNVVGKNGKTIEAIDRLAHMKASMLRLRCKVETAQFAWQHLPKDDDHSDIYKMFDWEAEILPRGSLARFKDPIFEVTKAVSNVFSVDYAEFISETRGKQAVSDARKVAMYISAKWELGTLSDIASRFMRKEHGTVIYALQDVGDQVSESGNSMEMLKRCLRELSKRLEKLEQAA